MKKTNAFTKLLEKYTTKEKIHIGDALDVDFEQFCSDRKIKSAWVVGNLPYNVSVPFFIKFVQVPAFEKMTLMFQKEVACKIFDPFGTKKNKGGLMMLAQNYFHISLLTEVAPECFSPPPKVESAVLSFLRRKGPFIPLKDFSSFEAFLRLSFSQRRKQLLKILSKRYDKEALLSIFGLLGLENNIRGEDLDFEQFRALYEKLEK